MSDVIDEVERELRDERLAILWQRYGRFVVGGIVAVIVITACVVFARHVLVQKRIAQTQALFQALAQDDMAEAVDGLEVRDSLRVIGLMQAAGQAFRAGDFEKAADLYNKVIALPAVDAAPYRGLAALMYVRLRPDETVSVLSSFVDDQAGVWAAHAGLELAIYEAGRNNYEQALVYLERVKGFGSVSGATLLSQVEALAHVYRLQHSRQQDED